MPAPTDDFDFIDPPKNGEAGEPSVDSNSLYAEELESYGRFDGEAEDNYERRVRHAFFVRELKQIDEIVDARKKFANKIYWLVVAWLSGLALILMWAGWKYKDFVLDDKILLALIGGTTLNVLGIFTIVTNFLFPKNGHSIFSRGKGLGDIPPPRQPPIRKRTSARKAQSD